MAANGERQLQQSSELKPNVKTGCRTCFAPYFPVCISNVDRSEAFFRLLPCILPVQPLYMWFGAQGASCSRLEHDQLKHSGSDVKIPKSTVRINLSDGS
ncbi:unnamed protein product [Victoria cruziana]